MGGGVAPARLHARRAASDEALTRHDRLLRYASRIGKAEAGSAAADGGGGAEVAAKLDEAVRRELEVLKAERDTIQRLGFLGRLAWAVHGNR